MDANREDLAGGGRAQNAALCDVLDGLPIWAPVISLSWAG